MSESSYMDRLLDGAEVEWKTLDDIAIKISSGGTPSTGVAEYYDGDIPWLRTQEVDFDEIWDTGVKITESGLKNSSAKWIPANCVIIAMYGATVGKIGINKVPMTTNQACANIHLDEKVANYRYVFHFLHSQYGYIKSLGTGSQTNINAGIVKKLQIPIPSLEIQAEIVRILDAFTELTAELTAELVARKQQYSYYHDQLLTFDDNEVEWKTLEDISVIFDSLHQTPQYTENGLSMIRVTNIKGGLLDLNDALKVSNETFKIFTKRYAPQKFDLVMSRVGSYGNVSIIPLDDAVCMGQNTVVIHPLINKKFLYYVLSSEGVKSFIEKNVAGGSQKTLSLKSIKAIPIPIPSEDKQKRIVAILNKFDTLTTSLTEGLPREIALRQQQYEYYRELLLSFPKTEVAEHD